MAPSSTTTSTPENVAAIKLTPSPRVIQTPLRLRDSSSSSSLTNSQKRGYVPRNWLCVLCNHKCDSAQELGHHYSSFHGNPSDWKCFVCKKNFDKKEKLYLHRREVHKNLPINSVMKKRQVSSNLDEGVSKFYKFLVVNLTEICNLPSSCLETSQEALCSY